MTEQFTNYSLAALCSVALHTLLVTLLVVGWAPENKPRHVVKPRYIEATLLQMEPKAKSEPKPAVDADAARRRAEQEKKAALEKEAARKREIAKREQAKKAEEQKRKAEAERKEKARQEQLKKEKLQKELAEKERLEEQKREAERRKAVEQDLASALAKEEDFIDSVSDQEQIGSYSNYIQERIENNWSRPPSARRGMEVILEIQLVPTGRVAGVAIIKSSGNAAFDRAAEQAVYKVGQFDELKGMDPGLFERNFRRLRLVFKPEDLRL